MEGESEGKIRKPGEMGGGGIIGEERKRNRRRETQREEWENGELVEGI